MCSNSIKSNPFREFFSNLFEGNLREQKEQGFDKSRRKQPITQTDLEKIYTDYFIPHFDNDPRCLQHKIFFEISFFLGKRGLEGLRDLKKDSFQLKATSEGKEYYELTFNEATKKSQGDDNNEMNDQPILLAQEGKRRCPVNSLKLYLSKLSHINALFQKPNANFKYPNHKWYHATPVGENTIGKFLKHICENAGLNRIYMNHCIRGTTATAMHRSGYSLHDIAQVTRHKNIESLKFYLQQPTIADMENYSESLFRYAEKTTEKGKKDNNSNNNNNSNSDDEFEEPPVKTRNVYDDVVANKQTKHNPNTPNTCTALTNYIPDNDETSNASTTSTETNVTPVTMGNFMQMYRQNPVGMFVGANLTNCTININMPK